jgi:hypothetical protein
VNRLRVVSYNRTKHKEIGPVSRIIFCLSCQCRFTTHLLHLESRPDPSAGARGAPSIFLALMVGSFGSPVPPHRGLLSMFLSVDDGRSRISISTSQRDRHRHFSALMVNALGSPSAPPRGPTIDVSQR